MELIAPARAQRYVAHAGRDRRRHQRVDHRVVASLAREHQVLVERSFHRAGVGNPQHGVGRLDVICDAQARLGLRGRDNAIVVVEAQAQIEGPVVLGDGVLDERGRAPGYWRGRKNGTGRWWSSGSRPTPAAAAGAGQIVTGQQRIEARIRRQPARALRGIRQSGARCRGCRPHSGTPHSPSDPQFRKHLFPSGSCLR